MENISVNAPALFQIRRTVVKEQKSGECCNVLFVCRDISAWSVIAEAILKRWGGKDFRAFSSGIRRTADVHPLAIDVLKSRNLWEQGFQTKDCNEFRSDDAQKMNFVVSIGDQPYDDLPRDWPSNPKVVHWRISDPIVDGNPAERALAFRRTFRELENRIKLFILVNERKTDRKAAA
ncbi:arsenate reductase ArsC [Candidatus Binatus sp.]|uniref:arsenate reductase ArsC n=1 Tax=Candidatus Binatus sp. TaxID=2811406 RepID=UPI003C53740B